jgi:dihydroflavonol-4-reductase
MIIAVTGATGFIGSHLVDALVERGHNVRALTRRTSNLRWLKGKAVEIVEAEITNPESMSAFVRDADVIYHIAGTVKARTWDEYLRGNLAATASLLEAASRYAPSCRRFLLASSQTAAGPAASLEIPVTEAMACNPITRYGRSKLMAEEAVRCFKGGIPWTIVRPCAVYGPRDTEILIYFQATAKGLNSMIGFDDKRLNLIHVRDLVDGMLLAAESDRSAGETYFLGSEEYYSWPQVGKTTSSIIGRKTFSVRVPHAVVFGIAAVSQAIAAIGKRAATLNIEKAKDITRRYWICDVSKARNDLGFRQQVKLEEGIRETFEWYKKEGWM